MPASINRKVATLIFLWLPVTVYMAIIFCFSSIPGSKIPHVFAFQDVAAHLLIYAVLGFFVKRALTGSGISGSPVKLIVATVIFAVAYGIIDEFHQSFVPGRAATVSDVFIDGAGSLIGGLLCR